MDFRQYRALCHKVFPHRDGDWWERDCPDTYAYVFTLLAQVKPDDLTGDEKLDWFALRTVTLDQIHNWLVLGESAWGK